MDGEGIAVQIGGAVMEWRFAVRPSPSGGFIAWCAKVADLGSGPLDIPLDVEVYFAFADSKEEALRRLRREVLH